MPRVVDCAVDSRVRPAGLRLPCPWFVACSTEYMDRVSLPSSALGWLPAAGARILRWWPAKMIGTAAGMTLFFVLYFWLLHHPQRTPVTVPLTAVDRWVDFQPAWLPVYLSLWIYVSLAPALLISGREIGIFVCTTVGLAATGLGLFLLWPTTVAPREIDWATHPGFAFLKGVDAAGNACPSLHVAFAVLAMVSLAGSLRELGAGRVARALNAAWGLGIIYSTVAIHQHVVLDALAGAALGGLFAALLRRQAVRAVNCAAVGTMHR